MEKISKLLLKIYFILFIVGIGFLMKKTIDMSVFYPKPGDVYETTITHQNPFLKPIKTKIYIVDVKGEYVKYKFSKQGPVYTGHKILVIPKGYTVFFTTFKK